MKVFPVPKNYGHRLKQTIFHLVASELAATATASTRCADLPGAYGSALLGVGPDAARPR